MTDKKFCDNEKCKKEIVPKEPRGAFQWWPVDEKGESDYEDATMVDFCSMACVKEWAQSL